MKSLLHLIMMLYILLILISCSTTSSTTSVQDTLIKDDGLSINKMAKMFELDALGNIYFVDINDHIFLYRKDLINYYEYSNQTYSNLTSIDVSNPQKILLFYGDFNTIVFLNNTLNEINRYNLVELGYNDISAAAKSNDNQTWIYDRYSYKLIKIKDTGEVLLESNPMVDLGLAKINPIKIIEEGNIVHLVDPKQGILRFDNLGSYIDKVSLFDSADLQVVNQEFLYLDRGHAFVMEPKFEAKYEFEAIDSPYLSKAKQIRVDNNYYYLLVSNGLYRGTR